jgi:hypothetical protein
MPLLPPIMRQNSSVPRLIRGFRGFCRIMRDLKHHDLSASGCWPARRHCPDRPLYGTSASPPQSNPALPPISVVSPMVPMIVVPMIVVPMVPMVPPRLGGLRCRDAGQQSYSCESAEDRFCFHRIISIHLICLRAYIAVTVGNNCEPLHTQRGNNLEDSSGGVK